MCGLLSHAPYVDVPACACRYWPGSTASIDRSTFDDAIHTIVVRALSRMKTYTDQRGMSAPSSYSHGPGARQGSCCGPFSAVSDSVCPTRTVRAHRPGGRGRCSALGGERVSCEGRDRERAGRRWARVTRSFELARPTAHYTHTSTRGRCRWPATAQSTRGERGPAAKPVKKRSHRGGKRAEAGKVLRMRRADVCGRRRTQASGDRAPARCDKRCELCGQPPTSRAPGSRQSPEPQRA